MLTQQSDGTRDDVQPLLASAICCSIDTEHLKSVVTLLRGASNRLPARETPGVDRGALVVHSRGGIWGPKIGHHSGNTLVARVVLAATQVG